MELRGAPRRGWSSLPVARAEGLHLRLEVLLEKREDLGRAEVAFRTIYRLVGKSVGRPKYPEFSWDLLQDYLERSAPRLR